MERDHLRKMTGVAVMAALMCVLGPLSVPLGPVPFSFTVLTVFLAVYALGMKRGTAAYLLYLLIGCAGLPVLSGFSGGAGKLLGPTGGYLFGFVLMALVSGWFIDRWPDRTLAHVAGMVLGLAVCYLFGTLWLAHLTKMPLGKAAALGVYPFVALDAVKVAVSLLVGRALRSRLRGAGAGR
ncbi:MAG: biotin transporter BioY [Pyramidobacter sp.]|nr:biotin transporter BioY [Pyramidobacter sp.]